MKLFYSLRLESIKENIVLVIPAHNEELVIRGTITSALKAGFSKQHIYVGSDNSDDKTVEIAASLLGPKNVKNFTRSGKAGVILNTINHFNLVGRYQWIHISDADGRFKIDYLEKLAPELKNQYAAVTSNLQALKAGQVSEFRAFEYGVVMEFIRKYQEPMNLITVIPGASCCIRSDLIEKLDFHGGTMTEDFDITLQIHRKNLGKIKFVSEATILTQDPKDSPDLYNQLRRWYRGFFQTLLLHKIWHKWSRIDLFYAYVYLQFIALISLTIVAIALSFTLKSTLPISIFIISEILINLVYGSIAAAFSGNWHSLKSFPFFIYYRWISIAIFIQAFIEVVVLNKYPLQKQDSGWQTKGRRYEVAEQN